MADHSDSLWNCPVRRGTMHVVERLEEGLPTAQLALAQLYAARRASPKDLVHAYMWFLIASEQIIRAENHVNKSMTMEQLLEAEQRAAEWMRKSKKIPPSSIENPPNASSA
jgi:TPR repeat protein